MAERVELEIFMTDKTAAGLGSAGRNVDELESQIRQLQAALNRLIAEQKKQMEANKSAGQSYTQEAANIQALTGQVRKLEEELRLLKKAKEETATAAPIDVDTEQVTRKMSNLRMQFQQVARELPSLAMGPQMFMLAIANNLPMLTDAIADARKQNELLTASGQKGVPVWRQLISCLFSWQTALMAGISLLVVYGRDIQQWVANLTKGRQAALSLAEAQEKVNEAFSEDAGGIGQQITRIRSLSERWRELGNNLDAKKQFIAENREELDKLGVSVNGVTEAENLLNRNTDQYIEAMSLRAQAAAAFKLAAESAEEAVKKQVEIEQEQQKGPSFLDRFMSVLGSGAANSTWANRSTDSASAEERQQARIKGLQDEKKAAEETEEAYRKIFDTLTDKAKKALKESGIKEGSGTSDSIAKAAVKENDYAAQLAEARIRAQQKTEQMRIALMEEGAEKRSRIVKQEYERTIAEIDKQERAVTAQMNKARADGQDIPQSQYDAVSQEAQTQRILAQEILTKKLLDIEQTYQSKAIDAQIAYNKLYGNYAEQRAAIIQEGLRKAAAAENNGTKQLIMKQTENALKELDFQQFKDSINLSDVFADLDGQTTAALETLRQKLKDYINAAAADLGPEDLKELQDAFKDIDFKLAERNPFGELETSLNDYRKASEAVEKAQNDLNTVVSGGTVVTGMYMDENGKLHTRLLSVADAERNLADAQSSRQQALSRLTASANAIGSQGMQVVEAGYQLVDMLENFGVTMPEAVTATLDGINQVMSGLASIDLTKPFTAVTGAVGILTGVGNTIAGLFGFGGNGNWDEYDELRERYESLVSVWDTLIDRKTQYISIDYGTEAQKAAEEAARLIETNIERQRNLLEQLARTRSKNAHSLGYRIDERMSGSDWNRLSQLTGSSISSQADLWSLSASQIEAILSDEKLIRVLDEVNSDFVEYLQNIVTYGDQLEEVAGLEKEAITGVGYESFRDGYLNLLSDLESTNQDFADSFEEQLRNAIFSSLIADKYASQIQSLYDEWTRIGADGITASEAEYLRGLQSALTDSILAEREKLMEAFGWTAGEEAAADTTTEGTDKTIEGLNELQRAYERLAAEAEKAYSNDAVQILMRQNDNLRQQLSLIERRIELESQAAEPDTDYLDDLKEQLEDINDQIAANKEAMVDAIFGEDIQSAISSFVSAYTSALGNGDTSQGAAQYIDGLIKGMVEEAMKADAAPVVEAVRQQLVAAWADGVISADERKQAEALIEQLNGELSDRYGWADSLFKGEEEISSEIAGLDSLKKAYDRLSESLAGAYSQEAVAILQEQNALLEQQKRLIEERIALESQRTDGAADELITGWKDSIDEINEQIAANKESMVDAIFGSQIQASISNFAEALVNAWEQGASKAETVRDFVNSIIRSMVVEAMKMDISPVMEQVRESLTGMFEDGVISSAESKEIEDMLSGLASQLEKQYAWADKFIEKEEQVVQTIEEVKESLTGLTLDGFKDSIVDGLSDMSNSFDDLCENFEDSLRKSIFNALIESQYKNRIQSLYNMWERYAESGGQITDKEAEQLRYEYQQIVADLMKQRDEMSKLYGWTESENQAPTTGALTTMSQDSISAFEGIGRNMQTHLASIDRYAQELCESQRMDSETLSAISVHTAYLPLIHELIEDMRINGINVR